MKRIHRIILISILIACFSAGCAPNNSDFGKCGTSQDCTDGKYCTHGQCVSLCATDNQCPTNHICKNSICVSAACGDSLLEGEEECDNGSNNSDAAACTSLCQLAICGDALIFVDREQCDDGNTIDGDGCDSNCTLTNCGNGVQTEGEQCDDNNTLNGDGCESDCTITMCGPTILDGTPCADDGIFCNGQETCSSGACVSAGNPCTEDELECTPTLCEESSQACNPLAAGYCLIQGICFENTTRNPNQPCEECQPTLSQSTWTTLSAELVYDGGPFEGDAGASAGDSCGVGSCSGGIVTCTLDEIPALTCDSLSSAALEVCNYIDDDCDGEKDEGYFGDYSNDYQDYPPSGMGPQLATYPDNDFGYIWGKILPAYDVDRLRIYATEANPDSSICNVLSDTNFTASVSIASPDESTYLEVCICWTEAGDPSCLDGSPTCATVLGNNPANPVTLELTNSNRCDKLDAYYLEIQVAGSIPAIDYSCEDWEIDWVIQEE